MVEKIQALPVMHGEEKTKRNNGILEKSTWAQLRAMRVHRESTGREDGEITYFYIPLKFFSRSKQAAVYQILSKL